MAGRKIGAVWRKYRETKEGREPYFVGEIEVVAGMKTKIVMFRYKSKKKSEKQPAYAIYLHAPKKQNKVEVEKVKIED